MSSNTTLEVGKKLVDFCRQKKHTQAVDSLYAPNVVNLEPHDFPGMPQRTEGHAAVRAKNDHWEQNNTIHAATVNGPFPNGDRFIVHFDYDFTPKSGPMANQRIKMQEAGLYTVKDGKIVQEEFFYDMPG